MYWTYNIDNVRTDLIKKVNNDEICIIFLKYPHIMWPFQISWKQLTFYSENIEMNVYIFNKINSCMKNEKYNTILPLKEQVLDCR
jgi:hypothetical protein